MHLHTRYSIHLINLIVYLLCSHHHILPTESQLLQFNSNRTKPLLPLPSLLSTSERNSNKYLQSLFQQTIPLNLDGSQMRIFLIAPVDNNATVSDKQLKSNSNLIYNDVSPSIDRKSAYMLLGRSTISDNGNGGGNCSLNGLDSKVYQNYSFVPNVSQSNKNVNNTDLISNPFASAPYRSSNDIIENLIQNIFSDLTLQSLPPEEILFGKLSSTSDSINPEKIFSNATESPLKKEAPVSAYSQPVTTPILNNYTPSNYSSYTASDYNYTLTNSNNYQPLQIPTPSPLSSSSLNFLPNPPKYEAGVEYAEPDAESITLDQNVFIDLNRIPESNVKPSQTVSKLSTTDVLRTVPTTFNTDALPTLPDNYGQYNYKQPLQSSTPMPTNNVQLQSQTANYLAPYPLKIQNPNLVLHRTFYDPESNTYNRTYNYDYHFYKKSSQNNSIYLKHQTGSEHYGNNNYFNKNIVLPTTIKPIPIETGSPKSQNQIESVPLKNIGVPPYSSISQRSKQRNYFKPKQLSQVTVPSEIAENLVNIISLPNYKFYLGKKSN